MNEPRNPYAPPAAEVADAPHIAAGAETFIPNGRRVPAGNGVQWVTQAFRVFFQAPGKWISVFLILFGLYFASGLIPMAGLAMTVLGPVLGGGIYYAVHRQRTTGTFEVGNIFSGFGPRFGQLAIVGAVMLLNIPLMVATFGIVLSSEIASLFGMGAEELDLAFVEGLGVKILLAVLVYLLLAVPLIAVTYLAPALIVLHGIPAGAAMKMSFIGLVKNLLPELLFGIAMLFLVMIALIPLGLGLLILVPVGMIASYVMYRDIFVEENP
jgi:uncharacterized membrane protein